ncbi:O-antigen ligase family protein, partial [Candidatus Kaiserbacteria bacterium]|nr:O-antigen ligase family protein [Candidatus Kaiserbacteria bacterium]
ENDYFFPYITGKNFGFRIIVDILFAAWVILAMYEVKYRPKVSGIVWSFGILLIVMFFANQFGVHPQSSFWSNFERMDGYVSLVHTFLYMLVLGSMLSTIKQWQYLLNTSLVVAFMVALYGLAQYGGMIEGASNRIDSRLGNAAYMAIYMLFHIFTTFWLFVETKNKTLKAIYGGLILMFVFVLIETGTRGTAVGLAVGVMVMTAYVGLFGTKFKEYRKYAVGGFIFLVIAAGAFIAGRDSDFIQNNQNMARIANISISDLKVRGTIWGMAWEGVKERPLLGYGQSNFNYVFNKYYDPSLYAQEQWFDRSHDIFFDWLTTGGFLGLIAYLSIFGSCLYYLLVRPLIHKDDETFTVLERGILLGILAGYFTHNLVVFDNIVSYIFFAIILGLIHSRVGTLSPALEKIKIDNSIITQIAAPVVGVLLVSGIYFFHVPGMNAAGYIIDAFRSQKLEDRLDAFDAALAQNSFAHQEITEQLAQQAMNMVRDPKVPDEMKQKFSAAAEEQLTKLAEEKPGDARIEVFIGSYYRATSQLEKAREHMAKARELSPNKQAIIVQQGFVELSEGKNEAARDFFQTAFELDERNSEAREYYAASLFYVGENDKAISLMQMETPEETEAIKQQFAKSDFLVGAANQAGATEFVVELFKVRAENNPEDAQTRASLAFLYYQLGDNEKAIETLNVAKTDIPSFEPTATCIIGNIENGREPQEGCK